MWPERAKSGLARLALATGAPVVPVATWGSHEVVAYHGMANMIRTVITAFWRRPTVRIHFGAPVDLSDLREGVTGDAQRASDRVMDAITADLVRLRSGLDGGRAELRLPRYRDPTRPVSTARVHRSRRAAASTRTDETSTGETSTGETRTGETRSAAAANRTPAVNRTAANSR
jgi:1-acyl-sn-glycerol-3-phosphate acyltransferase